MKTSDRRYLIKTISRRYLKRFFYAFALYAAAMLMLFILGLVIKDFFTWHRDSILYLPLSFLVSNPILAFVMLCLAGCIVIAILQWRACSADILAMVDAIVHMENQPDEPVRLPENLFEVQEVLQNIQRTSQQNRQHVKEAEQRKNDMLVYLAHDLKTPLTSVLGYLTLLRDEQDISPELRQKYLEIATNKAMRLEDLLGEFFEITRFSMKGMELQTGKLNFSRMMEQINDEFRPLYEPRGLQPVLHIEPDIELVADAGKLERVADNLLRNAVKYSYPGAEINITAARRGNAVVLTVSNHGNDIPQHKLEHIFDQFYRTDDARNTMSGGAGLGLAIAREIVDLHGGSLTATSQNNLITFEMVLPLAPPS